jgi:hypothetical protein
MSAKDVISPARNFAAHKRNETKQNKTSRNKKEKGENENKWRPKIFTRNLKMRGRGTRGDKVKNKYNFRNE